jgi:Glyoxalase-like domain
MHRSRLCAVLIECKTSNVDEAARFWAEALCRPIDRDHPSSRGNYRMLETPPDEPIVEVQHVDHESRVHLDIETDDIPAEVARLEKLGARWLSKGVKRQTLTTKLPNRTLHARPGGPVSRPLLPYLRW